MQNISLTHYEFYRFIFWPVGHTFSMVLNFLNFVFQVSAEGDHEPGPGTVQDGEGGAARAPQPARDSTPPLLPLANHAPRLPVVAGQK